MDQWIGLPISIRVSIIKWMSCLGLILSAICFPFLPHKTTGVNSNLQLPNASRTKNGCVWKCLLYRGGRRMAAWPLESNIVNPWMLKDVFFVDMSEKQLSAVSCALAPLSNLVLTWRSAETHCHLSCKWHTPLQYSITKHFWLMEDLSLLLSGSVHYLKDIYNYSGLLSFTDRKDGYNVPGSS